VFENRVLRRIFGPKRDEVRGTYGGGERCAQGVGGETLGKEVIGETQM
jgi:hypothetical protein